MTEASREHFMMDKGGVIQNPVQAGLEPISCRSCSGGKLGELVKDRATCRKCSRVHGFLVIKGKVNYGVCL